MTTGRSPTSPHRRVQLVPDVAERAFQPLMVLSAPCCFGRPGPGMGTLRSCAAHEPVVMTWTSPMTTWRELVKWSGIVPDWPPPVHATLQ